jgi:hypothetical protein
VHERGDAYYCSPQGPICFIIMLLTAMLKILYRLVPK